MTPYVIENLTRYDLSDDEAETLARMGMIFESDEEHGEGEREITSFVWNDLDLEGARAFLLFDAILGRRPTSNRRSLLREALDVIDELRDRDEYFGARDDDAALSARIAALQEAVS